MAHIPPSFKLNAPTTAFKVECWLRVVPSFNLSDCSRLLISSLLQTIGNIFGFMGLGLNWFLSCPSQDLECSLSFVMKRQRACQALIREDAGSPENAPFVYSHSVLVSVSCPKALYHLERDIIGTYCLHCWNNVIVNQYSDISNGTRL